MSVSNFTRSIRSSWSHYVTRRNALRELGALDDRQLADIGIERGRIGEYIRAAAV